MESITVGINRRFKKINKINFWFIENKVHLISWFLFVFWECIIIGLIYGAFGKFLNYAIHYSINIFLFYFHTWMAERSMKTSNDLIWHLILFTIIEITIYVTFVFYLDYLLSMYTTILSGKLDTDKKRILLLLWRALYFIFFSTGYFFLKRYLHERNGREQAELRSAKILIEKTKIENALVHSKNAFLRAQVNPHLLFNTFEFLHNKIKIIAPYEATLMVYLSDILRYAADTEFHDGYVRMGDEIAQCENLIKIYNITHQKAFIKISYSQDVTDLHFIPLVVITLLENILKHGDNFDNSQYSGIDIYIEDSNLRIESTNRFSVNENNIGFRSGINNIKNRLFYAYGNNFSLIINKHDCIYALKIEVPVRMLNVDCLNLKLQNN